MDSSWVNLLRKSSSSGSHPPSSPVRREILTRSPTARSRDGVRVSENTPQAKVGANKGARTGSKSEVQVLRSRIANLLKEKQQLELQVTGEHEHLTNTEAELLKTTTDLQAALSLVQESQRRCEEQKVVIERLGSERSVAGSNHSPTRSEMEVKLQGLRDALDEATREKQLLINELYCERERVKGEGRRVKVLEQRLGESDTTNSELERGLREKNEQVEGLVAHLRDLRSEMTHLSSHMTSSGNNTIIRDLERLTLRNAELSESLSATQHSRSVLEREVVGLKRALLSAKTRHTQLEESLEQVNGENARLVGQLQSSEVRARRDLEELQHQLNSAMDDKTGKVRELLSVSEQLQVTLSTLVREKDILAASLRQEATCNRQMESEKVTLEHQLSLTEERLVSTEEQLRQLQDHQVSEIDAKCQEIDRMKAQLEGDVATIQREREGLEKQLGSAKKEVELLRSTNQKLEGDNSSLRTDISHLQQERVGLGSKVTSLGTELAQATGECSRLKRELCELQEFAETRARQQIESLSSQLIQSSKLVEQLESEKKTLHTRVESLESQLSREQEERRSEVTRMDESLQKVSGGIDSALTELENTRSTNLLLQQEVSDLESQVNGLKEQLQNRTELTNEMKALLDQRAARIRQLERTVERQRNDATHNTSSDIIPNGLTPQRDYSGISITISEDGMGLETSSTSSLPSPGRSTNSGLVIGSPYRVASGRVSSPTSVRFSSPAAEVVHLKQRLADSRQTCVRLEMQQATLKTELAKLQGTVQALTAIRDHLTEEKYTLQGSIRSLEEGRVSCVEERDELLSELERVRENLESEVRNEREDAVARQQELQTKIFELEEAITDKDWELEQLQTSGNELQHQLATAHHQISLYQSEISKLQECMQAETGLIHSEMSRCVHSLSTLRAETMEVQETNRITEAVNLTRTNQIQEREASVSKLLAEVEVLRAKKVVVMRYLNSQEEGGTERLTEENKRLQAELLSVRCDLQHVRENMEVEGAKDSMIAEMRVALDDAVRGRKEAEELLARLVPKTSSAVAKVHTMTPKKMERLRWKLKIQIRQSNYLRLRLGYTIKELQLYKQLKCDLDERMRELQSSIMSSQEQYRLCIGRLQLAEQLGFC